MKVGWKVLLALLLLVGTALFSAKITITWWINPWRIALRR